MKPKPAAAILCLLALPAASHAARTPDELIAAINAVAPPQVAQSQIRDAADKAAFDRDVATYRRTVAPLLEEFATQHPTHPEAEGAASQWLAGQIDADGGNIAAVRKKAADFVAKHPGTPAAAGAGALQLQLLLADKTLTYADGKATLDAMTADLGPNRATYELAVIERAVDLDAVKRVELLKAVDAPPPVAAFVPGKIRRIEGVGKPVELSFEDVQSGKKITLSDYAGQPVIIDFWATWCGPCLAELPNIKTAYARLADKGLVVIGVSLDLPNAKPAVNRLLTQREIPWPNFYQGGGMQGAFSQSFGIDTIPSYLVIDKAGNLAGSYSRFSEALAVAEAMMK